MFSASPASENWGKFHNKYGNTVDDPANRRSMMKSAMSVMGSSARALTSTTRDSDPALSTRGNLPRSSSSRAPPPTRGNLPRSSSARVLAVSGKTISAPGRAAPGRTASGGLQALRGALSRQKSSKSVEGGSGRSLNSTNVPQRPRRSRSPMRPTTDRRSPVRPAVTAGGDQE